ncbi:MAG: hypothetical protein ACP5J1_06320 [Fervidicoccaceae archaeon]
MLLLSLVIASVFVYYSVKTSVSPVSPPIVFSQPPVNYPCNITLTSRTAIVYTDFEGLPSGFNNKGGTWSIVSGGYKGNALSGTDNGNGIGSESQYYYNTDLSNYTSLWITTKAMLPSGGSGWYGIRLINEQVNSLYTIEIYTSGRLEIWIYNNGWRLLNFSTISGYRSTNWYIIVVNYSLSGRNINIYAYLYDVNGNLVSTVTYSGSSAFTPTYLGVAVDNVNAYFDDFEISTGDPRIVTFNNTQPGMNIQIWDNLGNLDASATATSTQLSISIVNDIVVGTGSGGSIVVSSAGGYPILSYTVPSNDAILGGDVYSISYCPLTVSISQANTTASTSLSIAPSFSIQKLIVINLTDLDSNNYYASLLLSSYSIASTLSGSIFIASNSGSSSSPIQFSSGIPLTTSTSVVPILPGPGSTIAVNLTATGNGSSQLYLTLQYCSSPGSGGACVYYPFQLQITS